MYQLDNLLRLKICECCFLIRNLPLKTINSTLKTLSNYQIDTLSNSILFLKKSWEQMKHLLNLFD